MELFIKVNFWLYVVGLILRIIVLGYADYPRKIEKGSDVVGIIIVIPFLMWAAHLLWVSGH